jgi:hypothetical protein
VPGDATSWRTSVKSFAPPPPPPDTSDDEVEPKPSGPRAVLVVEELVEDEEDEEEPELLVVAPGVRGAFPMRLVALFRLSDMLVALPLLAVALALPPCFD